MADADPTPLQFAGFTLDPDARTLVDTNGRDVPLRRSEFELLRAFLAAPSRALSRDHLLDAVASRHAEPFDRSVDVLVGRLRRKVEPDPKQPRLIVTVPGVGYRFAVKPEPVAAESGAAAAPEPAPAPPAAPERRQLTILHCGLSGPALLAARRDPEDLQHLLTAFHTHAKAVVAEAGGTVERLLSDGLVAHFGYPQADEHQAERAVRSALKLIEAAGRTDTGHLGRLQVRIGVATGLAVVGGPPAASGQPTALGEATSVAAGLAARAEPDAVLISASTRRLVGKLFELRVCEPIALEGAGEPVEAWRVAAEAAMESRFEALRGAAPAPLVGREEELELLLRRWELAKAGSGKIVLVSGEPGIGKSRLALALRDAIAGEPHVELRLFCSPHHQDSALHPFIAQLERAAGFARDDTDDARLAKLDAALAQSDATDEAVALIAELLSIPTDQRDRIQQMTPQARRERTLAALLAQLTGLAARQPVLVVCEDLHWIDPSSRELLDRTIDQVGRLPVLLLATFRPEFQPPWAGQPNVTSLALSRLDQRDSAALAAEVAGADALPPEVAREIAERTDGVPLFIEEVTRAVLESGTQAGAPSSVPPSKLPVPATLHASLVARLDRLGPAAKDVAQRGAAVGREFGYELVAAIAERPDPELREALDRLTSAGLLFARGAPPRSTYLFKHALVRDAAYGTLVRAARQQMHARVGAALERQSPEVAQSQPELLAHHHTEAGQPEKAVPLWLRAGRLALRRMALAEAVAHLNRGLELVAALPPSADRDGLELALRTALGTAWMAFRGWAAPEVWDSLHPALGLARALGRTDALLPILQGLKGYVLTTGRVAESLRWATQIMEAAEAHHDPDLLIVGHHSLAISYFWLGELTKAREHAGQVLSLYTEERHGHLVDILNHDMKTTNLAYASHTIWILGFPEQAVRVCQECESHARRRGHAFDLAYALTSSAGVFSDLGQPDEALRRAEEAERLGRDNRLPFVTEALVPIISGIALIRKGQVPEGVASLRAGLAFWEATGRGTILPDHKSVLAEGVGQLGDLERALSLIEEVIAQVERPGWEERHYYAETLRIKGTLLAQKGDTEGAERSYAASLAWARHQQAKSFELRTATSYARVLRGQGRLGEARDLLAPIYGWFTEGFGTKDLREARELLNGLGAARGRSPVAAMPERPRL